MFHVHAAVSCNLVIATVAIRGLKCHAANPRAVLGDNRSVGRHRRWQSSVCALLTSTTAAASLCAGRSISWSRVLQHRASALVATAIAASGHGRDACALCTGAALLCLAICLPLLLVLHFVQCVHAFAKEFALAMYIDVAQRLWSMLGQAGGNSSCLLRDCKMPMIQRQRAKYAMLCEHAADKARHALPNTHIMQLCLKSSQCAHPVVAVGAQIHLSSRRWRRLCRPCNSA